MNILKKFTIRNLISLGGILLSACIVFSFVSITLSKSRIEGDAASHLMLAIAPLLDIGSPYKDIWEIKPPVWPLTLLIWSKLFGFGIFAFNSLNALIGVGLAVLIFAVYKKVFKSPVFEILLLSTLVVQLSPILNSIMLPTEIMGMFISMLGLFILMYVKNDSYKFYIAGLVFFAASQTKEPFTFTIISILPYFLFAYLKYGPLRFVNSFVKFVLGVLTSFSALYFYLNKFNAIGSYMEVYAFKQLFFTYEKLYYNYWPAFNISQRTFTSNQYGFAILLALVSILALLVNKYRKQVVFNKSNYSLSVKSFSLLSSDLLPTYSLLLYSLGSMVGFGLGNNFGSHYLIQAVVPLFVINGLMVQFIYFNSFWLITKNKLYIFIFALLTVLSLVIILPKPGYIKSMISRPKSIAFNDRINSYESYVMENSNKSDCILSIYGWGVSENYLYTQRKPCTRFFLPNIVSIDWQYAEYVKSIIDNPPPVIIYTLEGADMNHFAFEKNTLNFTNLLQKCYTADFIEKRVFFAKSKDKNIQRECIINNYK